MVRCRQWSFESFLSDYEQGAYNAVLDVFNLTCVRIGEEGCFFHLCKRLDFQVKRLGLMTKYQTDDDFKLRVKMLSALAFVPVSDIVANFEFLAITFLNDELPLLSYFESTRIGQAVGGRRLPPMFSHHMWNVLDRAGTGSTRTTNALESFHHSFNSLLSCTHPAVWKLLESLEAQQNHTRSQMLRISRGYTFKVSAINRRRNERIMNLISYGFPQRHWLQLPHLNLLNYLCFSFYYFLVKFYGLTLIITRSDIISVIFNY